MVALRPQPPNDAWNSFAACGAGPFALGRTTVSAAAWSDPD